MRLSEERIHKYFFGNYFNQFIFASFKINFIIKFILIKSKEIKPIFIVKIKKLNIYLLLVE